MGLNPAACVRGENIVEIQLFEVRDQPQYEDGICEAPRVGLFDGALCRPDVAVGEPPAAVLGRPLSSTIRAAISASRSRAATALTRAEVSAVALTAKVLLSHQKFAGASREFR